MEWENSEGSSIFAPSILTPEQFYDERRDDSVMRPIKRLMLAILEDALRCLQKYAAAKSGARRLMYWEAEQWLYSEGGNALFSFTMVCETLGIEPEYLRSGLLQWRRMQPRGDLVQRVARRSPVVRNGSIVSENNGREHRVRTRRRDRRIPMN
jgi:hypothetical protein